jgi:hypothetical protein
MEVRAITGAFPHSHSMFGGDRAHSEYTREVMFQSTKESIG